MGHAAADTVLALPGYPPQPLSLLDGAHAGVDAGDERDGVFHHPVSGRSRAGSGISAVPGAGHKTAPLDAAQRSGRLFRISGCPDAAAGGGGGGGTARPAGPYPGIGRRRVNGRNRRPGVGRPFRYAAGLGCAGLGQHHCGGGIGRRNHGPGGCVVAGTPHPYHRRNRFGRAADDSRRIRVLHPAAGRRRCVQRTAGNVLRLCGLRPGRRTAAVGGIRNAAAAAKRAPDCVDCRNGIAAVAVVANGVPQRAAHLRRGFPGCGPVGYGGGGVRPGSRARCRQLSDARCHTDWAAGAGPGGGNGLERRRLAGGGRHFLRPMVSAVHYPVHQPGRLVHRILAKPGLLDGAARGSARQPALVLLRRWVVGVRAAGAGVRTDCGSLADTPAGTFRLDAGGMGNRHAGGVHHRRRKDALAAGEPHRPVGVGGGDAAGASGRRRSVAAAGTAQRLAAAVGASLDCPGGLDCLAGRRGGRRQHRRLAGFAGIAARCRGHRLAAARASARDADGGVGRGRAAAGIRSGCRRARRLYL